MIAELGHFALVLAFAAALLQGIVPLVGAWRGWASWMDLGRSAALAQAALIAIAFGALMRAFILSDFSLRVVADNSHDDKPMLYKISGVWGNHEGSMLLWVLILALYGAALALGSRSMPARLKARVLAVQGLIGLAFLGFILFTSNPFSRLAVPPFNGADLNPLLQDPGLAFHPPFLYLGYVGLSVAFSFALAALIGGKIDAAWARFVRPWTLAAWMFLTLGIALGSWWAYYELGWGGFWFWDPVENASLIPWLFATALIHCASVVEKRESLIGWTVLLAILSFGFSLIGTFLVRSGVITSVHAFANDPERGTFILAILTVFLGGGLALFALRGNRMVSKSSSQIVSREGALVVNNLLLATSAVVVFLGTIWPMVIEAAQDRAISVGAPFFNRAVSPFFIVMLVILPIGAILPWKRGDLKKALSRLFIPYLCALAVAGLAFVLADGGSNLTPIGIGLGAWLICGAGADLWLRMGEKFAPLRLRGADIGRVLAHAGLGITLIGIAGSLGFGREVIVNLRGGEVVTIGPYEVRFMALRREQGPNYIAEVASLDVMRGGAFVATMQPERRVYPTTGMPTTEAAIRSRISGDLYLVLGEAQQQNLRTLRLYLRPFAPWIWFGAVAMALGAGVSLLDRRLRLAPQAKRAAAPAKTKAEAA